jgi:hypothetical protein
MNQNQHFVRLLNLEILEAIFAQGLATRGGVEQRLSKVEQNEAASFEQHVDLTRRITLLNLRCSTSSKAERKAGICSTCSTCATPFIGVAGLSKVATAYCRSLSPFVEMGG